MRRWLHGCGCGGSEVVVVEVRTQIANLGPVFVKETVESGQMVMVEGSFVVGRVLVVMFSLKLVKIGDGSFGDGSASTGGCST